MCIRVYNARPSSGWTSEPATPTAAMRRPPIAIGSSAGKSEAAYVISAGYASSRPAPPSFSSRYTSSVNDAIDGRHSNCSHWCRPPPSIM